MLSRIAKRKVQAELDLIAEELESQGLPDLASQVDEINDALMSDEISSHQAGNELERIADKAETILLLSARRKKRKRRVREELDEEEAPIEKKKKKTASDVLREYRKRSRLLRYV